MAPRKHAFIGCRRYKSNADCPRPERQVVIGKCEGNQIYDTSMCIDCNAECVSAAMDPQGRGQFIERECMQSSNDFVCRPCSASCPAGSFISSRCSGRGRTDTGCTLCKAFCRESLAGVPGAHGQYISGLCTGETTSDVQSCRDCKQCPDGYYPTGLCSGVGFEDTVQCNKCRTECPAGFYLQGDCRVEEVTCVPCDPPCANQSSFLQEKRACANSLNRVCVPNTKCKDASCPAGYYESATCTDPEGPKFCSLCRTCKPGQYQSMLCSSQHNRQCTDCTSECPDALNYVGIIGECKTGMDTFDAVTCVPASYAYYQWGWRRQQQQAESTTFGTCGANEWYVGTRTPMFSAAAARDSLTVRDEGGSSVLTSPFFTTPFKSDFSPRTFNTIAYLGVEGGNALISVFSRARTTARHSPIAIIRPRENFYNWLDVRGNSAGQDGSPFPIAIDSSWNAIDVMLSHNDTSVYVFFSRTYDFIAQCSLEKALEHAANQSAIIAAAADEQPQHIPYEVPASECSYFSARSIFYTSSVELKGCTRMFPWPSLACLYETGTSPTGSRSVLYAVDETTGAKTLLDNRDMAYNRNGIFLNRPKSPPAWDPAGKRLFYMADLDGRADGTAEMALRFVTLSYNNASHQQQWTVEESGIRWRGGSDASYHSLVYTVRSGAPVLQPSSSSTLMAMCRFPSCTNERSLVTFSSNQSFMVRGVASSFSEAMSTFDVGVRWYWAAEDNAAPALFVGQQIYLLSRDDKRWGLWTHCAPCPANSFSPAGSTSGGIGACKCVHNFYGLLQRPVVDTCMGCRIKFERGDGVTVMPESRFTNCADGEYKTNVPCSPLNLDRSVDSTCARCQDSCRPGDVATLFPGEYISRRCDGTGFDPAVQCTQCASACDRDDVYMQQAVVCTGRDDRDTRLEQACVPCRAQCPSGFYVHNRCVRGNAPSNDTTVCLPCEACQNGEYISRPCNGSTFKDARECSPCRYGGSRNKNSSSRALGICPGQNAFVLNECLDGRGTADETACSTCNQNCVPANFSKGENGQYILELCSSIEQRDSVCEKCSGRCLPYSVETSFPGQYIVGFCTGTTQFDRTCANCRASCLPGQYIAGERCTGESDRDTTFCEACTPNPAEGYYYTQNPCTGETREDQRWQACIETCGADEYISGRCSSTSASECTPCRTACPAGYYMLEGTRCDGTSKYDTSKCVKCSECQPGQYMKAQCIGNGTSNTVECAPCGQQCAPGQYVFGLCSGLQSYDETSCKECTVCERDFPNAYNSIHGSCESGRSTKDDVTCALNDLEFSFPGDSCPPGYFASKSSEDALQRIDTEFRRITSASLRAAAEQMGLQKGVSYGRDLELEYNALVPMQGLKGPFLWIDDLIMVSTTVRDAVTWEAVASSTGLERFQVCESRTVP